MKLTHNKAALSFLISIHICAAGCCRTQALEAPQAPGATGKSSDPSNVLPADSSKEWFPVWYGTNREFDSDIRSYGAETSSEVTRGRAYVQIPKSHQFSDDVSPSWYRFLFVDRFHLLWEQYADNIIARQKSDFYVDLNRTLSRACQDFGKGDVVVYIHGYNVSFSEATIRTAQLGRDLQIPGAIVLFSWPSKGKPTEYIADLASAEASAAALASFLTELAGSLEDLDPKAPARIRIIAHSMGNRVLLNALRELESQGRSKLKARFGQALLVAADVDQDVFLTSLGKYLEVFVRVTLYCADSDYALWLSSWLNGKPRAGYYQPYCVADSLDTILVPEFDVDAMGHSYYANAAALLYDMRTVMISPDQHIRLRQRIASHEASGAWQIRR